MHLEQYDLPRTKFKAKAFLTSIHHLRIELTHLKLQASLQAIQYDGMPKSPSVRNSAEDMLVNQITELEKRRQELNMTLAFVNSTLQMMKTIDEKDEALAILLECRYIKQWSVIKCCDRLAKYFSKPGERGPIPEQTFYKRQDEALMTFIELYPNREELLVEK